MSVVIEPASVVRERVASFAQGVLRDAMNRPSQIANGELYLRGLLEQGQRKSLEPLVGRLGGDADYQSMQQFLADSPWDPGSVVRAVAERVVPHIGVRAWVLDDTGFPKAGKHSPGVKRQYSGTLGQVGNCQIGVSLHAVGDRGTVPIGWALFLPQDWCSDDQRRRRAKVPDGVEFRTKPELGVDLAVRAAAWGIDQAPVLGDQAYGENTRMRDRLHEIGSEYVLAIGPTVKAFSSGTVFAVPVNEPRTGGGRLFTRPRPDSASESVQALVERAGSGSLHTVRFRESLDGQNLESRFVFLRVRSAHYWRAGQQEWRKGAEVPPREEWLIAEWPAGNDHPSDYWISNMPADTPIEDLAHLARLRWKIELDYRELKGELGLDHYEGRSWLGWYHHTALVTAAHGFLTLERLDPFHRRLV